MTTNKGHRVSEAKKGCAFGMGAALGCGALCLIVLVPLACISLATLSSGIQPDIDYPVLSTSDGKPILELMSWGWEQKQDVESFVEANGEVRNISDQPIENVQAIISFKTSTGDLITTSSALTNLNPILPGQISQFKVLDTYNPEMSQASPNFTTIFGKQILWKLAEK